MLSCVVNVPLQPARVQRTPQSSLSSLAFPLNLSCAGRSNRLEDSSPSCGLSTVNCKLALPGSVRTRRNTPFSNCPVLKLFRTLVPTTPLFSHSSLKHPGVAYTPSNPCPLCNLSPLLHALYANTPYPWPIALCFARCHNSDLGGLLAQLGVCVRRFPEDAPPPGRTSQGQETFLRSVVSNRVSGRGLGSCSRSKVPRGPKQGSRLWAVRVGESRRGPVRPRGSSGTGRTRKADRVRLG
jgi:hypothetical protein